MSLPWIFVSPSSRGIGQALTTHLLRKTPLPILATTRRDPSSTKDSLLSAASAPRSASDRLHVVKLDVTNESTVAEAARRAQELFPVDKHHLHLALAIPGILHAEKNPAQVDYDKALESYKVNSLGPLMLLKHFFDFLPRNAKELDLSALNLESAANQPDEGSSSGGEGDKAVSLPSHATWLSMSARVGSITDNRAGGWYSYRSSKAAVTSLCKSFDNFLRARSGDKAMAVAYHPGTVKTDLSKDFWHSVPDEQLLEVDFAAARMIEVVSRLGSADRGKLWDWKGEEVPP